ncbi:MAG: hypothetical protein K2Q26_12460 [Bdellovibrionales bacterium]|nr:hypothetical protein [Bdellovibrionales bacterium]
MNNVDYLKFTSEHMESELGIDPSYARRVGPGLLLQLYLGLITRTLHYHQVLDEINHLEGKGIGSRTRPPDQFLKLPLKGLYKKHYSQPNFIPRNVATETKQISKDEVERCKTWEEMWALYDPVKLFEQRIARNAMTGQWIVFAKHENENYYLCLGSHNDDENILKNINKFSTPVFSFLADYEGLAGT